jgi:hypothetical protein
MAGFDMPDDTFTQILRTGFEHRKSAPDESEL